MRPGAIPPSEVRLRFGGTLGPTGEVAGRFAGTADRDRQILADAEMAGARFLITEDVDDFAEQDLASAGISAVNPDLFLSKRLTRAAYASVIDLFVQRQVAPPTTRAEFHRAVARQHPLLFAAHADLYEVAPYSSPHPAPRVCSEVRTHRMAIELRLTSQLAQGAGWQAGSSPRCRSQRLGLGTR